MDAIRDHSVTEIVVMKAAQVGWTEILNNCIGYHIHQEPAPILLLQPTLEMAEAWSKDRLAPMIRDTPVLTDRIADPRSRDSGNTLLHKRFLGGHLTVIGANSPAGLASRPIRILLCDEVDRFPTSAGSEGDPIDLAKRRTATFRNRKILMGSTPTVKGSSRIEAGFEQSDQRFYFVPCPKCGEFQKLAWAQIRWPEGHPELAVYVCAKCGHEIDEAGKLQMLLRGEWRATKPSHGIAGFHLSGLYSVWTTWREMAQDFLRAKRFPETLQTWINTALGETWEDKGDGVDASSLYGRRESYTANSIPPGVLLLTVGTDVQDDRLEVVVWGWGADEECWRIEHRVLRGDPGQQQVWADHDDILRRRFQTDDGRTLVIESCCVDSGGHFTEQVYRYCAKRKRFRVWAIKGIAGPGKLIWPRRPTKGKKIRVDLWLIGVDTIKDIIYGRLKKVLEPGPGYLHFDADTDEEWFEQLTSETVVYRQHLGRRIRMWRPRRPGIAQEGLDCAVYGYAAMVGRGGSELLRSRVTGAAKADSQATVPADDPDREVEPAKPPKPRVRMQRHSNWITGWRK